MSEKGPRKRNKRDHPQLLADYPLVLIEWIDASRVCDGGWTDLNDVPSPDPHKCVSVGFLVRDNERGKIIIPTIADVAHPDNRHVYGGIMISKFRDIIGQADRYGLGRFAPCSFAIFFSTITRPPGPLPLRNSLLACPTSFFDGGMTRSLFAI